MVQAYEATRGELVNRVPEYAADADPLLTSEPDNTFSGFRVFSAKNCIQRQHQTQARYDRPCPEERRGGPRMALVATPNPENKLFIGGARPSSRRLALRPQRPASAYLPARVGAWLVSFTKRPRTCTARAWPHLPQIPTPHGRRHGHTAAASSLLHAAHKKGGGSVRETGPKSDAPWIKAPTASPRHRCASGY